MWWVVIVNLRLKWGFFFFTMFVISITFCSHRCHGHILTLLTFHPNVDCILHLPKRPFKVKLKKVMHFLTHPLGIWSYPKLMFILLTKKIIVSDSTTRQSILSSHAFLPKKMPKKMFNYFKSHPLID